MDQGARHQAKSIVFDVRSETPQTNARNTPKIGPEERNVSAYDTEVGVQPNQESQDDVGQVRVSSPVMLAALPKPQVLVNNVGEPYFPDGTPEKTKKEIAE